MQWQDLLYFSKGERRALTLLLSLITLTWILLQFCSEKEAFSAGLSPQEKQTVRRQEKFNPGTVVELNSADTTILKKIPGIGSVYANRIIKYRNLLGGFSSIEQLKEVYGIEEDKFTQLKDWFEVDNSYIQKLYVNTLTEEELRKHPYINYQQARIISKLRKQKKIITGWENLILLKEFPEENILRLQPYVDFSRKALATD